MRTNNTIVTAKILLPFKLKEAVLAFGSQSKNTLCFAKGNFAFLSRAHADLSNPEDYLIFERDVRYFLKMRPKIIACDLHPEYQSTKSAISLQAAGYRLQAIQHHHAHIASCMVDNGLTNQKVIGVSFDGTGLGSDNTLWGGEFLLCDYHHFQRLACLKEIALLGGEKAILEPWRIALEWLDRGYREKVFALDLEFLSRINRKDWRILKKMQAVGFNAPLASSMGRLFDAVGVLLFNKCKVSGEAELPKALEELARNYPFAQAKSYDFQITQKDQSYLLDPSPMFKQIVRDLGKKPVREKIALSFHLTVARMIQETCLILRKKRGIKKVILCGGVFQNKFLSGLTQELLSGAYFKVFTHQKLSSGDAAISLGQAVIAYAGSKKCV